MSSFRLRHRIGLRPAVQVDVVVMAEGAAPFGFV